MSTYQPVVILGAGRSGTNLLRDALVRFPGVATWPCDEVNYLWRTGNARHPTDELPAELAGQAVKSRVRAGFDWVARQESARWVVEKTCANSLRVGFVDRVVPDAKYLAIVRDGYDVTASAMKRWRAPAEPRYLARKARFVPWGDLPYYASRYLRAHLYRMTSRDGRLSTWGPRFAGLDELCRTASLAEVCATQWRRCVEATQEALGEFDPERYRVIRYEDLVREPAATLRGVAAFLGLTAHEPAIASLESSVFTGSIGAGRRTLSEADVRAIGPIIEPTPQAGAAA